MHYYQFNIGDYATHTQHLDPLEDIAYRRMLDWIYTHESPLPDNINQIAKYIRMRDECERIADVLREYFELTEYGYMQPRIQKEIDSYKEKSKKAKASAKARWAKSCDKSDANALQAQSERNAKQETRNNKQETRNKVKDQGDKSPKFNFKKSLLSLGVDEKVASEWLRVRRAKKATNSEIAFNKISKEISKTGLHPNQAITIAVERSWSGFSSNWIRPDDNGRFSKAVQQTINELTDLELN
jgi:uncharacterized protein YdaU (DUF1376 family)